MRMAKRVQMVAGFVWAVIACSIVIAIFLGMNRWTTLLVHGTGLHVSSWYSGNDVGQTIDHADYRTIVRKPVFQGIFHERSKGFVQLDWIPHSNNFFPKMIHDTVDLDGDGSVDAVFEIETRDPRIKVLPYHEWVQEVMLITVIDGQITARIALRNFHKQ